jgi:hypothetical protein
MFDRLTNEIRQSGLPTEISHEMAYLLELDDKLTAFFRSTTFPESDETRVLTGPGYEECIADLHEFLKMFFPETPATLQ